jgi:NADH-quinone oxidoreductase subunit C
VSTVPDVTDAASVLETLREDVPGALLEAVPSVDMPTIVVDRGHLIEVCQTLRTEASLQFALLSDLTVADFLPAQPRYTIVYHLACLGDAFAQPAGAAVARRLRLKVHVAGDDARLPTVTPVWPGAGWLEREAFDLFGIVFDGHPDLRRILMTDDWEGHPLRKDYPVQIRKDTSSWSPLQITVEEFAENIRAARDGSRRQAEGGPFDTLRRENALKDQARRE